MIKKLSIFLIILFIFSFINVNKIYGEEEKSFEISFNNPYFVDYSDFSLPEFENFDNFILIPGSPIIPYKIYNYEFSLNTEIIFLYQ
ncbi:MAG: hypothetical protein ACPLN1_07130 [Caldisericia bacterium]